MGKHKHHIIPDYKCKELGMTPGYKVDDVEFYFKENMLRVDMLDHARIHWGYFCDDLEPLFEYITPAQWIIDLIPRGDNRDVGAYRLLNIGNSEYDYSMIYKDVARFPVYYDMPLWNEDYIRELEHLRCIKETKKRIAIGYKGYKSTSISPKSHQDLMSRNWFSLSKRKRTEPIFHEYGDNWVKITAGDDRFGIASIYDYDMMIFIGTKLVNAMDCGEDICRSFQFTGYEFFQFTGKKKNGGKGYADLWKSLQRLHNTNIRLGTTNTNHSFNWLSSIKQVREGNIHRGYEIIIPEWFYESITNRKMMIILDNDYFNLRCGLEKWLYLFERLPPAWHSDGETKSIENIYRKSASSGSLASFRRKMKNI
jgi:hypothetical protein